MSDTTLILIFAAYLLFLRWAYKLVVKFHEQRMKHLLKGIIEELGDDG